MQQALLDMSQDEKVKHILQGLQSKRQRNDIALELGYKNYRTMDIFMRRQGYSWDRLGGTYVLTSSRNSGRYARTEDATTLDKVREVLALFAKGGMDAKEIANRVGFESHRDLAVYMKSKGYTWDSQVANYIMEGKSNDEEPPEVNDNVIAIGKRQDVKEPEEKLTESSQVVTASPCELEDATIQSYLPLLQFLKSNEVALKGLLARVAEQLSTGSLPRYSIPGVFVTKSVHMSNQLDQMVRDYSAEKNIAQRDIFEIALVEFFKRYGYEREIETILKK